MKTNYNVTGSERKALVKAIADHLGEKAVYLRTPTYAYQIGDFTVTKDGTLEFSDWTDSEVVEGVYEAIAAAGFTFEAEPAQEGKDAETVETAEEETGATLEAVTEPEDAPTEKESDTLTVSLPLAEHTATSLRNLISMIYARGPLLSKASGGHFSCTMEQVNALKDCITTEDVITKITPDLVGLDFTEGKVNFTGFPFTEDAERIKTFTQLAAQMNKLAKEQKRTMAKTVDATNEKYIFRIWLLALGMGGDEFKTARRVLLHPLTGSAAFKDQAMEDRWKAKQAAKRDAKRSV